jgi:hypothetical protein
MIPQEYPISGSKTYRPAFAALPSENPPCRGNPIDFKGSFPGYDIKDLIHHSKKIRIRICFHTRSCHWAA